MFLLDTVCVLSILSVTGCLRSTKKILCTFFFNPNVLKLIELFRNTKTDNTEWTDLVQHNQIPLVLQMYSKFFSVSPVCRVCRRSMWRWGRKLKMLHSLPPQILNPHWMTCATTSFPTNHPWRCAARTLGPSWSLLAKVFFIIPPNCPIKPPLPTVYTHTSHNEP